MYISCHRNLNHRLLNEQIMQQPCQGAPTGSVWLMQCWMRLEEEWGCDSIDPLMWSIVCALPAFLLCRNNWQDPIGASDVDALNQRAERRWKNSVTEGAWLPRHITSHLMRSLSGVPRHLLSQLSPCIQFALAVRSFFQLAIGRNYNDGIESFNAVSLLSLESSR